MNEKGWILLSRKFLDWQWWDKPEMVKLWLYLLLTANIEDKKWQGIEIKRGQLVTSRAHLSKAAHLSERTARTCLARLQQTGEITIKTTKHYTLITICNYNSYQDYNPNNRPTTDQQLTNNRPTTDQQSTTTKQLTINNDIESLCAYARESEENEINFLNEEKENENVLKSIEQEKEKSSAKKEKEFVQPRIYGAPKEPPTIEQIKEYILLKGYTHVSAQEFFNWYESTGWAKVFNWRARLDNWESRHAAQQKTTQQTPIQIKKNTTIDDYTF